MYKNSYSQLTLVFCFPCCTAHFSTTLQSLPYFQRPYLHLPLVAPVTSPIHPPIMKFFALSLAFLPLVAHAAPVPYKAAGGQLAARAQLVHPRAPMAAQSSYKYRRQAEESASPAPDAVDTPSATVKQETRPTPATRPMDVDSQGQATVDGNDVVDYSAFESPPFVPIPSDSAVPQDKEVKPSKVCSAVLRRELALSLVIDARACTGCGPKCSL